MFFCCLKTSEGDSIQESLIEDSSKPSSSGVEQFHVQMPGLGKKSGGEDAEYKGQGNDEDITSEQHKKESESVESEVVGTTPSFSTVQSIKKPPSAREFERSLVFSKKSHLWSEQLKRDLIYLSLKRGSYIYMSYRVTKNQYIKEFPNALDYFLSKSQDKIHVIVGNQAMINGRLETLCKYDHNLIVVNYGSIAPLDQSFGVTELIVMKDLRNVRWGGVDSLVVLIDGLHSYEQVKVYFNNVLKDLGWYELKKTTFLFPVFMTLENISQLMFASMKQYAMGLPLEKASLDLAFDMELIECANLDAFTIVKSRTEKNRLAHLVYDRLKTSIVMFGKQLNHETQKLYRDFYIRIREKTLKDYFEMKELYRRNPQQFRAKVNEVRDFELSVFESLERATVMKEYPCEDASFYYVIPNKVREEIGRIFNIAELQKKEIDTPVKREWDDDATAADFKTVKTKKLDMLDKEELDKIDMDMGWMEDDEDQFYTRSSKTHPIQPEHEPDHSQFARNRDNKTRRYDSFQ